MGKIWKKEIKAHFGLWDFRKRGKSAHLMCASLNAPCLWGIALHALGVLGAIITTLLTYSIVVYI